ncbi:MAG: acetate--CoA ligase family protein [Promethearchaeota archaeon]
MPRVDIDSIFNPKSVAIIGASRQENRNGYHVLKNIIDTGFTGKIYPINPKADEILGIKVYKHLKEIDGDIDNAIIILPTHIVVQTVKECVEKGVKSVIIITEGFAETGTDEGKNMQQELKKIAKSNSIRIVGPGTMGVVNLPNFTSTYVNLGGLQQDGKLAFIAQSGIFAGVMVRYFASHDSKLSKIISLGNKIDVDDADIIDYLAEDKQTKVIALYMEGISSVERLIKSARNFTINKGPIVLLKGGRTPEGAMAARSHTSSLAVDDRVFDGLVRQTGMVRVDSLDEFIDTSNAFATYNGPVKGNRVAIITYSGALGVLTSDQCVRYGLQLAKFSDETNAKIHEVVPDRKWGSNPIDTYPATIKSGNQRTFTTCLEALMNDENVDCVLMTVWGDTNPDSHENKYSMLVKNLVLKYQEKYQKPAVMGVLGEKIGIERQKKFFMDNGIIAVTFMDRAPKILMNMFRYYQFKSRDLK